MQLDLQGLGKSYDGDSWAVRDLDLHVPSSSIFGLIGPNGAGKSTALRMIASVMEPTVGDIRYDGCTPRDIAEHVGLRRRIGFLGDGNPLYKAMTTREYLRFFGQCFAIPPHDLERAIEETLATFNLAAKRDARCADLSKGMRQRLLIARCLLHRPTLLILDEPADGLDPRGRSDLRDILKKVRDQGVTVIISSHILRELDDLCDRVAILQRGRIIVSGDVGDIIDRFEVSRFVYRLRLLSGLEEARQILGRRRVLIEEEGREDGLPVLSIQVQGQESAIADTLAALVQGGVQVLTCSRVRSRLEDVYNRLSEDQVN